MKCSCHSCTLERFEDEDKCIFHCEKTELNGWILSESKESKESFTRLQYKWNVSKVDFFWKKIRQIIRIVSKQELRNQSKRIPSLINAFNMKGEDDSDFKLYFNFFYLKIPPLNWNSLSHNNSTYGKCVFNHCTFYDNFILTSSKDKKTKYFSCDFHNCTFEKDLSYFRFSEKVENVNISNSKIKNNLNINGNINKININSLNSLNIHIGKFLFYKTDINDINIFQSTFKKLVITGYKSINNLSIKDLGSFPDSNICMENISLNKVYCQDIQVDRINLNNLTFVENSNINFENIDTNELIIDRINQDAKSINLNHTVVSDNFICKRVNFKNTSFNDFNIANANKVIEKVSFYDANLNSIEWGNIGKIKAKKDIFRQLKFLNDKQGNHIEANNFYSMEMKKHKEELSNYSWFSSHFQEKTIFLINEKISYFGQNWILPFLWMILVSVIFYYFSHFGIKPIDTLKENYSLFIVNDILKFSNPFNKSVSEEYGLFYWAWLFHKLFMTIFVYHFVIAVKRQTKR